MLIRRWRKEGRYEMELIWRDDGGVGDRLEEKEKVVARFVPRTRLSGQPGAHSQVDQFMRIVRHLACGNEAIFQVLLISTVEPANKLRQRFKLSKGRGELSHFKHFRIHQMQHLTIRPRSVIFPKNIAKTAQKRLTRNERRNEMQQCRL